MTKKIKLNGVTYNMRDYGSNITIFSEDNNYIGGIQWDTISSLIDVAKDDNVITAEEFMEWYADDVIEKEALSFWRTKIASNLE